MSKKDYEHILINMCTHIETQWWKISKLVYLITVVKYKFEVLLFEYNREIRYLFTPLHIYLTDIATHQIKILGYTKNYKIKCIRAFQPFWLETYKNTVFCYVPLSCFR